MEGGSDTINSNTKQKVLSALMEVQAKSSGSSEKDGLILTGVPPEAVVFKWDLEGVK